MATLYVETSLPMSIAMGRDPDALALLRSVRAPHELVFPAICLMEALSAFQRERGQHNEFGGLLDRRATQLRRDLLSGAAAAMLSHLQQARLESDRLLHKMQARLVQALEELNRSARLIALTTQVIADGLRVQDLRQMTDNLILQNVLADAVARPGSRKALLTGNTNDFRDPQVLRLLIAAGIEEVWATAADAAAWLGRVT